METSLNVTDYPEPKEKKYFVFECECSCTGTITIYADNEEEAREILNTNPPTYDDIDYKYFEIENIVEVRNE